MRRSKGSERRTRMLGVKLEPSLAAQVEEAAAEDGRTTSTYLYRLVKADLDRRALIAETGPAYHVQAPAVVAVDIPDPGEPPKLPRRGKLIELEDPPQNQRRKKAERVKPQHA